jgi:hypothetical protein
MLVFGDRNQQFGRSLRHLVTAISELDAGCVRVFARWLRSNNTVQEASIPYRRSDGGIRRELIRERTRAGITPERRARKPAGRGVSVDMAAVSARRAAGESLRGHCARSRSQSGALGEVFQGRRARVRSLIPRLDCSCFAYARRALGER